MLFSAFYFVSMNSEWQAQPVRDRSRHAHARDRLEIEKQVYVTPYCHRDINHGIPSPLSNPHRCDPKRQVKSAAHRSFLKLCSCLASERCLITASHAISSQIIKEKYKSRVEDNHALHLFRSVPSTPAHKSCSLPSILSSF